MSSLKEIRIRISSVSSTRQITSAMRMVSASKLKKAQDKILKVRPYATKLREMLEDVSMNYSKKEELPLIQPREIRHVLLVLITSNRGLCGGFNLNAAKFLMEITQEYFQKGAQVHVMAFGKKGYELIKNYP
ncbi:MAG: F0F1 ATP synthase subunit gamma, partial [Bacteroidales bacterium]|nr:F0F1 ATP synthase subunit gamma [Bacteroidales bacterium]